MDTNTTNIANVKNPTRRSGQTLIEALVALTILTTGFIGITTLLTKSFQLNRISTNDTQATYLASEGIEVAKSLIDHDVYTGLATPNTNDWGQCFAHASGYYSNIDYEATDCATLGFSASADPQPLYFDTVNHVYTWNKGVNSIATNFARSIKVTNVNANEIDVQSTVKWISNGISNSITLEDQFYNWHPESN